MNYKTFKDLRCWQSGHQLVLKIYQLTKYYPTEEKFGLTNQMRRSAASVCANIAEGIKMNTAEFARFLRIAQGSLEETKYHIILSKDLGYIEDKDYTYLITLAEDTGKMLFGLISKLKTKQR